MAPLSREATGADGATIRQNGVREGAGPGDRVPPMSPQRPPRARSSGGARYALPGLRLDRRAAAPTTSASWSSGVCALQATLHRFFDLHTGEENGSHAGACWLALSATRSRGAMTREARSMARASSAANGVSGATTPLSRRCRRPSGPNGAWKSSSRPSA